MKDQIDFRALTFTLSIAFGVSYVVCLAGDLLFGWTMYEAWAPLLPGFTWPLSLGGTLIGLIWLAAYSVYFAALVALPYNYLVRRANSGKAEGR
jgi:hypothetical protein